MHEFARDTVTRSELASDALESADLILDPLAQLERQPGDLAGVHVGFPFEGQN